MIILGLGTATPDVSLDQADIAGFVNRHRGAGERDARRLDILYRRSGVRRRGCVLARPDGGLPFYADDPGTAERMEAYDRLAPPLAAAAARRALADADLGADAITHLVTASCTGFRAPGVDLALFGALGLRPTVERTHVGFMGCHGAQNAIRVAAAIAGSDPAARVLVVAVELTSLHFRRDSGPEQIVSEAIFADGAGALVGAAGTGPWRVAGTGSTILPGTADAMTWRIGDRGFEMGLSARVPEEIETNLRPWLEGWLGAAGLTVADVATWAVHPGGPRILGAAERALGLPPAATATSREVLAEHGNMSSATMLFVLERLRARGAPLPAVALGFGPGLTVEATRIGAGTAPA